MMTSSSITIKYLAMLRNNALHKPWHWKKFYSSFQKHHVSHQRRMCSHLSFTEDRYQGVHVDLSNQIQEHNFSCILKENLLVWQNMGATCVWLKVPIEQSNLIPEAAKRGFIFHHAEGNYSMLFQWLDIKAKTRIPRYATHQVGVSGCAIRLDTQEVLVVRDKNRPFTLWKFPGGLSELGEDISATAEREVFEETGIKSEFQGILAFRQQHNQPGAFGRSDFYFICHMKPLTYEINPCSHEIEACQWMNLTELANNVQNSAITQRVIQLVLLGLHEGFNNVHLSCESFKSVYKGLRYNLFNRVLPNDLKVTHYAHNIAEAGGYEPK